MEKTLVLLETDRLKAEITADITLVNINKTNEVDKIRQNAEAYAEKVDKETKGFGIELALTKLDIVDPLIVTRFLKVTMMLDTMDSELQTLFRRHNIFDDGTGSSKVVIGVSDTVVTV